MNDTDEVTERLEARMAYLGIRDKTPTADLLPTRSFPSGMVDPECRDVAAFLVRLVRATYVRCRRKSREVATRRPDRYGDHQLARWDGGYDWRGRYHAPVWAKIAAAAFGAWVRCRGLRRGAVRPGRRCRVALSQQAPVAGGPGAPRAGEDAPGRPTGPHRPQIDGVPLRPRDHRGRCRSSASGAARPRRSPSSGIRRIACGRSSGTG